MARENLLDQSRAGTGQADDEDGIRRLGADPRTRREESRSEYRSRALEVRAIRSGVVVQLGTPQRGSSSMVRRYARIPSSLRPAVLSAWP